LQQHREVDAEGLADTAQRVLYLSVHPARMQVDKPGGEIREQRLEPRVLLEVSRMASGNGTHRAIMAIIYANSPRPRPVS
jgi:hypothetical protein